MAGIFGEFSVPSISQEIKVREVLKNFGGKFGAKFGTKIPKLRQTKNQKFTPNPLCRALRSKRLPSARKRLQMKSVDFFSSFRSLNGKTSRFPQLSFRIRFRNDHVGHVQATTTGDTF